MTSATLTSSVTVNAASPAKVKGLPIYTYFNFTDKTSKYVPGSLWKLKMVPTETAPTPVKATQTKLFDGNAVDVNFLAEDLAKAGFKISHIHWIRFQGDARFRVTWQEGATCVPDEQMMWVLKMMTDFVWDARSYKSSRTTYLPEHINISLQFPTARKEASSVQSIQLFDGEISLITDTPTKL